MFKFNLTIKKIYDHEEIYNALLILLFTYAYSYADHGPRIQFIHNSPADAATTVDIWVSFANVIDMYTPFKMAENLKYKEAVAYTTYSLIYGDLVFYVTPAESNDTSNYLLKKSFGAPQIDYEETFVVVISGDSEDNFDMILTDGNEESFPGQTNLMVFHGALDAPEVNIEEISIPAGLLYNNLEYGEAQGYSYLASNNYVLQVQTTDGSAVADFSAPLSFFEDQALFLAASGYLDTTGATPNNPFKLLAVEIDGTVTELNPLQDTTPPRLQIVHNSASAAAAEVDVWISDENGSSKILSDFSYKQATPYIDAAETFTVSITAAGSTDTSNAVLHKNFILNRGLSYVVVAAGDPGNNFNLFATEGSEFVSSTGKTDVKIFHGSVGAPMVDVDEVSIPAGIVVDNLAFGDAQGYLSLASVDYDLQVKTQEGIGAAEFSVPLSVFQDSVLFVAATGYLDTTGATPNNAFKLLAVAPSGSVVELEPKESLTPARLQIIHNSAVPNADFVDIYLDDEKILDDFAFRTATSFIEVPGATVFMVDVNSKSSLDNSFPLYSESFVLASGRTYIVVASGLIVFGSENYFPFREFDLIPILNVREESLDAAKVDVMVFHGATDAPMVDVNELTIPVDELVNDIDYGMSQGYLELEPNNYELEVALASSGTPVMAYGADVSALGGKAITILASGFVDPLVNNDGANFGLWVALPEGGDLIELPGLITSVEQSFFDEASTLVYPNPANNQININFSLQERSDVNIYIYDLNGRMVKSVTQKSLQKAGHSVSMNISDLKIGLYFLSIQAGQSFITRKIQVVN